MKKRIIAGILVFLILFSIVSIAINDTENIEEDIKSGLQDAGKDIQKVPSDIGKKTDEFLEKEVILPENLQPVAKVVFGIKETISVSEFIILVAIWFGLLLLVHSALEITPFFEGWKAWFGSFIVTCIIAVTGAIKTISDWLYNTADMFKFLEGQNAVKIILALIIAALLIFFSLKILKIISVKTKLTEAERAGVEAGAGIKMAREAYKTEKEK